ncbi:unnamed protein product [Caenorhabditis angaria]|uniref:Uncharacterized protein n=1 Tax=Caenorhabditis angaria TaxID=860376 RepID=A0A9P1MV43_9PELO|nr:unnamed protein product [Caenorhabditis angaria]
MDDYPIFDDVVSRTYGETNGNITVVLKGTPKIDDIYDKKSFWIWSWINHNCTRSGSTLHTCVDLGKVNPKIVGVNYVHTVNLHDETRNTCTDNYRNQNQ